MKTNTKLQKWMEKNIPVEKAPTSILYKFKDDIKELYSKGYTQNQILQYLDEEHNIQTTQQNLSVFINRHINKSIKNEEQNQIIDELQQEGLDESKR